MATLFVAAGIAIPHLLQDDDRLLTIYIRSVKRIDTSAYSVDGHAVVA